MMFQSIQLNSGKILKGEKIGELVTDIVNKFSEAELSSDEAKIVLGRVESVIGECNVIQKMI